MDLKTMAITLLQNECPRSRNDDGTIEYWINLCCMSYKIIVRPTEFSQTGVPLDYDVLSMDMLEDEETADSPAEERQRMYFEYVSRALENKSKALSFDQWMVSRGFGYSPQDSCWVKI